MERVAPATVEDAAGALRAASGDGATVRFEGGGTKLGWGRDVPEADVALSTRALDGLVEHNAADLTAVVEAGMPLARAQDAFAREGQMLACDPPLGGGRATVGGVVATGDSGPLRWRYGAARDLLLGVTVVLSDGTVARSGGKVIKNVAGYDLAKLFAGSFGTLGLVARVALRLHPRPPRTVTARGATDDPDALARAAVALARRPLEADCLDYGWRDGAGEVLVRLAGAAPEARAEDALGELRAHGLETSLVEDDDGAWDAQRARQRAGDGAVVRVSGLPTAIGRVIDAAGRAGGEAAGRAGLGLSWVTLRAEPDELAGRVEELRRALAPAACTILDAPRPLRAKVEPWATPDEPTLRLMRRVKARFDPAGTCNPGVFVGGI